MTVVASAPAVTIALPVLDERATLEAVARSALAALDGLAAREALEGELLIVDDGSTDGSGVLADDLAHEHPRVRVVHHASPSGYAEVQRACYALARGAWVLLLPADGQVDPGVLALLWPQRVRADLVVGIPNASSAPRRVGSCLYHLLGALLFGRRPWWGLGPCLLVRRSAVEAARLRSSTPGLMTELAVRIERGGGAVHAVPVPVTRRRAGRSARVSLYPALVRILVELLELRLEGTIFAARPAVDGSGEPLP